MGASAQSMSMEAVEAVEARDYTGLMCHVRGSGHALGEVGALERVKQAEVETALCAASTASGTLPVYVASLTENKCGCLCGARFSPQGKKIKPQ